MGDLSFNLSKGISPRKLFAFFPNTLLPNSQWNKTLSLCLYSSSPSCFNLQSIPTSSVCSAQRLHPPIQFIITPLIISTLAQSLISQSLLCPPGSASFPLVSGDFVLGQGLWCQAASGLCGKHRMSVGTVLFQTSSYGQESTVLCCLSEGTSKPSERVSGRIDPVLSLSSVVPRAPRRMGFFQVCLCLVLGDQPQAGVRLPAFVGILGVVKCFFSTSSYAIFQK